MIIMCEFFALVNHPERACSHNASYYIVFNDGVRRPCCAPHTDWYRDRVEDIRQKDLFTKVPTKLRKEVAVGVVRYEPIEVQKNGT